MYLKRSASKTTAECASRYQFCGRYHAKSLPAVVKLDEIAWRFPTADIVALRLPAITGTKAGVYLCSAKSAAMYTELTGEPAPVVFQPGSGQRRLQKIPGRVECRNIQPTFPSGSCGVCKLRFFTEDEFAAHQVEGFDGRPICPESPARYRLAPR